MKCRLQIMERKQHPKAWDQPSESNGEEEVPTINEFMHGTTFHGVKYIFDTRQTARRILWVVAVLTAIGFFVGQCTSRIVDFFEHKTVVSSGTSHRTEITFPSVTLCNQNNYRVTATADKGLYHFIDTVYSSSNSSSVDLSDYPHHGVNTTEFIVYSAHQLDDLVDRCTWRGQPCDRSHFKLTLTDLGVCYTFNYNESSVLTAVEPGSKSGLTLLLNVEQYEYMRGPQIDAGVKIHLHDQGETPQMKDQGFSVAPGSHTFVGITRYEVTNLPHPYGECEDSNPVPVSECQQQCKTKVIVKECGCLDVYMQPYSTSNATSKVCSMEQKYTCVLAETEKLTSEALDCVCKVPCKRVYYHAALSYAQLSRTNVEKFVIQNEQKRTELQEKFHAAMETTQRSVADIVVADEIQMSSLLNITWYVDEILRDATDWTQNFSVLAEQAMAPDVVYSSIVEDDNMNLYQYSSSQEILPLNTVLMSYAEVDSKLLTHHANVQELMVLDLTAFPDVSSELVAALAYCNEKSPETSYTYTRSNTSTWLLNVTTCGGLLDGIQNFYREPQDYQDVLVNDAKLKIFVNFLVNEIAENGRIVNYDISLPTSCPGLDMGFNTFDYTTCYTQCLNDASPTAEFIAGHTALFNLAASLHQAETIPEALAIAQQILSVLGALEAASISSVDIQINLCDDWSDHLKAERTQLENTARTFMEGQTHDNLKVIFDNIGDTFGYLCSEFMDVHPTISLLEEYRTGDVTKMYIADAFLNSYFFQALQEMEGSTDDLYMLVFSYITMLISDSQRLGESYLKWAADFRFPPINEFSVSSLELVKAAQRINETGMQDIVRDIFEENNIKDGLADLIRKTYQRVRRPVERLETSEIYDMLDQSRKLYMDLEDYQSSAEMDADFYMNNFVLVDIFYQELSYEKIEQNIAFEFLSLLGEIGGFLGLLLGASVLTVFELLDYIVLSCLHRCRRKHGTKVQDGLS